MVKRSVIHLLKWQVDFFVVNQLILPEIIWLMERF